MSKDTEPQFVYFITYPTGEKIESSISFDEKLTKRRFLEFQCSMDHWKVYLPEHVIWPLWAEFEKKGFTLHSIELPTATGDEFNG